MSNKHKKVFVGMSGGVDSSVSAAILLEQGYDVVGVFIKVWQADFLPCTWREERREAMRAAAHLGIPFLTLDLEKEYKDEVVDHMIREYRAGRVPNPDVMCNKHVKFGGFLDFARAHGADFIATGHYAEIKSSVIRKQESGNSQDQSSGNTEEKNLYHLFAGVDKEKDQSYFLWTLSQDQLAHTLFPVGHLQKTDVRTLAKKFGLPNAEKKDSQGLCFMGPVNVREFLKHYLETRQGDVLDEEGNIIGTHEGAMLYTIGQRHGFKTKKVSTQELPYFVVTKDLQHNTITVAHRDPKSATGKIATSTVGKFHTISAIDLAKEINLTARIRYRGELFPLTLSAIPDQPTQVRVNWDKPIEGIARGQSVVFYKNEECVGGAVIVE